ncbi:MAG: ferrous iron transporter B [Oscillospiraceae bacterium]|nr:ferrous iron transporter B [Oscillospiraceae bacterium]
MKMGEKKKLTVCLAGNPNVGKSTLFNALTGGKQHTGNWTGKTVLAAKGCCESEKCEFEIVDLPGTYSLSPRSAEEEVTRDYILKQKYDGVVVVCDAGALERNLNLVLQIAEITDRVIVCVNLLDEAEKRGIRVDLQKLSQLLGVPVVGTVAKRKKSVSGLLKTMELFAERWNAESVKPVYPVQTEMCISELEMKLGICRYTAVRYLTGEMAPSDENAEVVDEAYKKWANMTKSGELMQDVVGKTITSAAERIIAQVTDGEKNGYGARDRKLDRILTSKAAGYPAMVAFLAVILWITIVGANYPSQLLSMMFSAVESKLTELLVYLGAPDWLYGALVLGVYRVLSWVVSVMLPPMAIFFPLFTLLEDAGYLPRIAYNLDKPFQKCSACGKQALTMW